MVLSRLARCLLCGDTFCPSDESDLIHVEDKDGKPCGGQGELLGLVLEGDEDWSSEMDEDRSGDEFEDEDDTLGVVRRVYLKSGKMISRETIRSGTQKWTRMGEENLHELEILMRVGVKSLTIDFEEGPLTAGTGGHRTVWTRTQIED